MICVLRSSAFNDDKLKRKFYDKLKEWKNSENKNCLLVKGARQIGKTYIIDVFAHENYKSYIYINFVLGIIGELCFRIPKKRFLT